MQESWVTTEQPKKFGKKTAVCIVLGIAAILYLMVVIRGIDRNTASGKVSDTETAAEYLLSLGWEVDLSTCQMQETALPEYFDTTFAAYNKLQLEQGFDLEKFAGKSITVYTFQVTNYTNANCVVLACLMTCKNRVIGGDIHSAELDGFMHALQ